MAGEEGEFEVTLKWKNADFFEMSIKADSDPKVKIVRVEENGNLAALWDNIKKICVDTFSSEIDSIGEEMKK